MKLSIIGSGYVGLVAGTCFADSGNDVICVDIDKAKIAGLERGELPIYEPGLEELVKRNVKEGRLTFSTDLKSSVGKSEVVFIAVGTPEGETGEADLKYVLGAAKQIGEALTRYTVIVDKSTVPVGTADKVREAVKAGAKHEFDVVSNPEFLKEGAAIDDFLKPDRVVVGVDSERVGADVDLVRKGMGSDKRIGYPFLFPGVGYGGSCFPKDVKALITTARENGLEFDMLRATERINERQKKVLVSKAVKHFGPDLTGKTFAVWGLAFKPRTDDMREAPAIEVIEGLIGKGARVQAHDPVSFHTAKRVFGSRIAYAETPYAALEGADALVVVTEWNEFRHPDFDRLKSMLRQPVVFDGRNVFDPALMRARGFTYYGIGRRAL